jgi:hypothetical protein
MAKSCEENVGYIVTVEEAAADLSPIAPQVERVVLTTPTVVDQYRAPSRVKQLITALPILKSSLLFVASQSTQV